MEDRMTETAQPARQVTLIVPLAETQPPAGDRAGGQTHSLKSIAINLAAKAVSEDALREGLEAALGQVRTLFANLRTQAVEGWQVESLSVSLAITAEGSVGVATAGAEASIEVTFQRAK
jgi:hypothetical protein